MDTIHKYLVPLNLQIVILPVLNSLDQVSEGNIRDSPLEVYLIVVNHLFNHIPLSVMLGNDIQV